MHASSFWRQAGLLLAAVLAGACMSVQARINGALAAQLGSGVHAATISFGVGMLVLLALWAVLPVMRRGMRRIIAGLRERRLPWWGISGGAFGAGFVFAQGTAVPELGVAVFMVSIVVGQLLGGLALDGLGAFGAARRRASAQRMLGAAVALAAVVAVAAGSGIGAAAAWLIALGALAGCGIAVQLGLTGLVKAHAGDPLSPTLVNFVVGTAVLVVAAGAVSLANPDAAGPLPGDWWLYLGGPVGILYIGGVAIAVRGLGVLLLSLGLVGGQLLGSVVLDLAAGQATAGLLWGVPLAFVGIALVHSDGMRRR